VKEEIVWHPGYQRPSLRDGHILAKIKFNTIFSGVYFDGRFVYDQQLDFPSRKWEDVEMWCYYPKGEKVAE
jgi:hypothetical protein